MSKFRKLLVEAIQQVILRVIFIVGLGLSLIPFMVLFTADRQEIDRHTFGQALIIVLLLTACSGISFGLYLFYTWLAKRWGHKV
jgi:hypothetical protein